MEANLFIKTSKPMHTEHKVVEDAEDEKRKTHDIDVAGVGRARGWHKKGKKMKTMTNKKRAHTATQPRKVKKTAMALAKAHAHNFINETRMAKEQSIYF